MALAIRFLLIFVLNQISAFEEGTAYINRISKYSHCYYWIYILVTATSVCVCGKNIVVMLVALALIFYFFKDIFHMVLQKVRNRG